MRGLWCVLFLMLSLAQTARAADDGNMLSRFLESTLSGDNRNIEVTGLKGALSSHATIERLTVADDDGVWLTMTGAVLDWAPLALATGRFSVNTLSAEDIIIARLPGKTTTPTELPSPEAAPFQVPELPVSVELGKISVGRLVLKEPVAGVAAALQVNGALTLDGGALDTTLAVTRIDRPGDKGHLKAQFANETRHIGLDLSVVENAGGLISAALGMPDRPALSLTARGDGPVTDFTANLALASDSVDRVTGQVRLRSDTASASDTGGIAFDAQVAGDVTPFLPPDYRGFFGSDSRLYVAGLRAADGRLDIPDLSVTSKALHLRGALKLAAGGRVDLVDLTGGILPADEQQVVLPLTGPRTAVRKVDLAATLDRAKGDRWTMTLTVQGLTRQDLTVASAKLAGQGVAGGEDGPRVRGTLTGALTGIAPADPALARAVGQTLALDGAFTLTGANALQLAGVELHGADYRANVDGIIRGLSTGFEMQGKARLGAANLSRFSDLAGRPLGGAITARIEGMGAPLDGRFDAKLTATARNLRTGIPQVDALAEGQTTLALDAARGVNGLVIRSLRLDGADVTAQARASLRSGPSSLHVDARLADLAKLTPNLDGPLTVTGDLNRVDKVWTGAVKVRGPHSSYADLTASMTPDGSARMVFDAELARLERLVPDLAGTVTAKGTADRSADGVWTVDAGAKGPAGIDARIGGTWTEASGRADLTARGQLRLDAANPVLKPNSITGTARFDLALKGAPSLDAVSGTITTSGATVAVPSVAQTIRGIEAKATLADGQARIAASGTLGAGGTFAVNGPVTLAPPFDGRIVVDLNALGLTDGLSVSTSVGGQVVYAGPLAGAGSLSGHVAFGETDINLTTVGGSAGAAPIPPISHRAEPGNVRATRARAGLVDTGTSVNGPAIALDLTLSAHNRVYVHGFGLSAEMGGDIAIGGTTRQVAPAGQIEMIRGALDLLGRKLTLTKGVITMQGDLKPYVDFQSARDTSEGTATIKISGPVNAPEIKVFSDPERPTEEALAMLLFGNSVSQLSPLAIAQMAASLARMGRSGGDPTQGVKHATGVDTVDLGTSDSGAAQLTAGGYISRNIHTDVTVNTDGQSELNLNLDLTDSLTVKGAVDNAGDTSVGLFYSRDY